MPGRYPHLLSPLKIGKTVFRNRLFSAPHCLHALQGGEPHPTEAIMTTFGNKARGGAALITLSGTVPRPWVSDGEHLAYDIYTKQNRHYLAQLASVIHFYGAKTSMEIGGVSTRPEYDVVADLIGRNGKPTLEMDEEIMNEIADNYAFHAAAVQDLGYDMVLVHMAYRSGAGKFLSPATNRRTDQYGGPIENRARFPILIFDCIKQKCGRDFLIELRMSGTEPGPGGITLEDSIQLAKLLESHIDLLQVHAGTMASAHPLSFLPSTPNLSMAAAIKKSGTRLTVVTIGGYQDLDEAEKVIASGQADIINIARGWIADPELGTKAYTGRSEDVVPCIKCMRCHDSACLENRTYVCSVNPVIGLEHHMEKIIKPPTSVKKVAIVGGGPAGMQAALTAASRGHSVTLYEKSRALGGQLNYSDFVSFKKTLSKYKNYLIRQVEKAPIKVCLNTSVTPELLAGENYDEVIAALGAQPSIPPIPGIESEKVILAPTVYGHEPEIRTPVVVIGGGQVGCETALHLAMLGLPVTLLEMQSTLAADASYSYRNGLIEQIEAHSSLKYILNACCTAINDAVFYRDAAGLENKLTAGSIIIATGMLPRVDEALTLWYPGVHFALVGDCSEVGNLEGATRSGFGAAAVI